MRGASTHGFATDSPMRKKMATQAKDEYQTTLLTLTSGFFSLTQDGIVVTNPKLKRIVPRTADWEPYSGSLTTASIDQSVMLGE